MTMKYMKMLMATTMCCLLTVSMTACGDDTMNSATYGEEEMDNVMDETYNEGDTLMDDVGNGIGDVIHGTEDVLDDAGDDIRDGLEDGWDELMDGDSMEDGIYDDGDMSTADREILE